MQKIIFPNKHTKKAQVTIFIILGILIFVSAVLFFFSGDAAKMAALDTDDQEPSALIKKEMINLIKICTADKAVHVVDQLTSSGGFKGITPRNVYVGDYIAPVYFDGVDLSPSTEQIEEIIKSQFATFSCPAATDLGYQLSDISVDSLQLEETEIQVNLAKVEAQKGEEQFLIEPFTVEVPSKLGLLFAATHDFLMHQQRSPEKFKITRMADAGIEHNVTFKMDETRTGEFLLVATTEKPFIDDGYPRQETNTTMQLPFIVRFDWS